MKKTSVILVALLLLLAGMSLSAEGKWTNWGEGILYPFYKVGNADASAGWGPVDWGVAAGATGQYNQWTFAWDGDNVGFTATLGFDGKELGISNLKRFGAYYKFFNNMLKLTMGAPRVEYVYFTKIEGANVQRLIDGDYGAVLEATPIAGLTVAAVLYVDNVDPSLGTLDSKSFGIGASYEFPNIVAINGVFRNDLDLANVSVKVLALKGIDLMAAYQADWTLHAALDNTVYVSGGAAVGPVNLAVDAGLAMLGDSQNTLSFAAELQAQYKLTDMYTLGVVAGYDNGVSLNGSGDGIPASGFAIYPYVKAGFGDSSLKIGFIYASGYEAHQALAKTEAVFALPITYVISF